MFHLQSAHPTSNETYRNIEMDEGSELDIDSPLIAVFVR